MPTAHVSYEGLDYSNAYPSQREIEFELRYVSPDKIEVGQWVLDPELAVKLLTFLTKPSEFGPCGAMRETVWHLNERADPLTPSAVDEVAAWLACVLGHWEYEGSYDVWERP